jgi:hypothetical protein
MNQESIPSVYVTADIVSRNQVYTPQVIISDVFDIPDIPAPAPAPTPAPAPAPAPAPTPAPTPAPVIVTIPLQSQVLPRAPTPVHVVPPVSQAIHNNTNRTEQTSNIPINFIKAINHTAMTDVMNQAIARNTPTVPSIGTKKSDHSIPVQIVNTPALHANISRPILTPIPTPTPRQQPSPSHQAHPEHPVSNNKTTHRIKPANTKIIIEDDDKDSAIDYDDDDPEIKKTKLSLFHFAKDVTFNLIFTIPFLRTKLNNILREPTLAINQIERVFDEFKDQLNRVQLDSLKKYVCEDGIRDKLNFILESGFNKILSDGKIDINDAPQFNQLVYFIIKSFNNINQGKVYRFYISSEHVMILLHFILKSVFTLTLKGEEEQMAIGLLDTSFKLVQIEVLPLISKRWYHRFTICHAVKEIEELIE